MYSIPQQLHNGMSSHMNSNGSGGGGGGGGASGGPPLIPPIPHQMAGIMGDGGEGDSGGGDFPGGAGINPNGGAGGIYNNGGSSIDSIEERKRRNREHAKRSRVRKKYMLESLQAEVFQLQEENKKLRRIMAQVFGDKFEELLT
jgi:hypothetical protein